MTELLNANIVLRIRGERYNVLIYPGDDMYTAHVYKGGTCVLTTNVAPMANYTEHLSKVITDELAATG